MVKKLLTVGLSCLSGACCAQFSFVSVDQIYLNSSPTNFYIQSNSQASGVLGSFSIRNTSGPIAYFYDVMPAELVGHLYWMTGILSPYGYRFEIINNSTGATDPKLFITAAQDLTGFVDSYVFPSQVDHAFKISFAAAQPPGYTGADSYTLYFRIYDSNCSTAYSVTDFQVSQCRVFQLPVKSFNVRWDPAPGTVDTGSMPLTPPGSSQTIYPMINHRPFGIDPPTTRPISTFLSCNNSVGLCQL